MKKIKEEGNKIAADFLKGYFSVLTEGK